MTDGTTLPSPPLAPEVLGDLVARAAAPGASLVAERLRELLRGLLDGGAAGQVREAARQFQQVAEC